MEKEIYLKIDTDKGVVTIPFKSLEEVDRFTVIFSNKGELVNSFIEMLQLEIDLYDVTDVYLTDDKYKIQLDNGCLPIKYSKDNFNYKSLEEAFVIYIKNDQKRILTTDMRYLKTREILKFFDAGFIDTYEIERAVRAFFDGTGYKRKRNTYFMIKDEDGIVIKCDKVDEVHDLERGDLSKYYSGEEDYLSHLIELSQRNPEMIDRVMDEIAQSDMEELASLLKIDGHGIVDGASDSKILMNSQIRLLEETTGISIDELREHHTKFGRKRRYR